MPLTDAAIRNAKPREAAYKVADAGGLFLLVNPGGSKLWRLKYRIDGKEKLLAIGAYPAIGLAQARASRDQAKAMLAAGTDPSAAKQAEKQERAEAETSAFRLLAGEYLAKCRAEGRAPATLRKLEWLVGFAVDGLGDRPIRDITSAEVLAVLRKVQDRGTFETARRLRSTISTVFSYAIASAKAETDPTLPLRRALTAPKVQHRAAILDSAGLGALLRAIDGYEGQLATKAALQLMPLLVPRPGELRTAEWCEFDLDKAIWVIPAHKMKMRREHRVPLPAAAVEILQRLKRVTGNSPFAFPSVRSSVRPMSNNTLNAALRRLGYATDEMTAHGFRASAATMLNESGRWHPDAIERQLAHVEANSVRRAYARGEYWDERVRMMEWWSGELQRLKGTL